MDNLDNYLVFTNENILTQVYYRQVLSETSWFEVTLGRNFNRMHANVNGNDDFTTYEPIDYRQRSPSGQAQRQRRPLARPLLRILDPQGLLFLHGGRATTSSRPAWNCRSPRCS